MFKCLLARTNGENGEWFTGGTQVLKTSQKLWIIIFVWEKNASFFMIIKVNEAG